jgi:hypothetical protein
VIKNEQSRNNGNTGRRQIKTKYTQHNIVFVQMNLSKLIKYVNVVPWRHKYSYCIIIENWKFITFSGHTRIVLGYIKHHSNHSNNITLMYQPIRESTWFSCFLVFQRLVVTVKFFWVKDSKYIEFFKWLSFILKLTRELVFSWSISIETCLSNCTSVITLRHHPSPFITVVR